MSACAPPVERIGLVINDLPTVESKAPSQFGGVLLASARYAPLAPDKGYNTHDTLWCTPQPRRSPLSRRFWLCQFIFGLLLSRGVTLVRLVCCFVVRSSPSVRGGSGARRLFQDVMIAAYSAWGLALSHVGFPVHVWRCRRPSPYGGLDPLRRETSTATVAIHASGGRCSTRPCAHAIGPSSFSAVILASVFCSGRVACARVRVRGVVGRARVVGLVGGTCGGGGMVRHGLVGAARCC